MASIKQMLAGIREKTAVFGQMFSTVPDIEDIDGLEDAERIIREGKLKESEREILINSIERMETDKIIKERVLPKENFRERISNGRSKQSKERETGRSERKNIKNKSVKLKSIKSGYFLSAFY